MKTKLLSLLAVCLLSLGAVAQNGTLLFYESFGEEAWYQGEDASVDTCLTANFNPEIANYKVNGNFYSPETFIVHDNWAESATYPGASKGSVLGFGIIGEDTINKFRFKVNTSNFPYAEFSFAYASHWSEVKISYSTDGGSSYVEFTVPTRTMQTENWIRIVCPENIGGHEEVIIMIEPVDIISQTTQIDDLAVTGYNGTPSNIKNATTLFYEPFTQTESYHKVDNPTTNGYLTSNTNPDYAAYKPASGNFFFADDVFVLRDFGWGKPSFATDNSAAFLSNGDGCNGRMRIQVKTTGFSEAYLTCDLVEHWSAPRAKISYSTDNEIGRAHV